MKSVIYLYLGAGALVLLAIAYVSARGAGNVGKSLGAAIIGGASNLAGGVIQGGTAVFDVPMTDEAKCKACIAARDWWGVTKYCPAGTTLSEASGAIAGTFSRIFSRSSSAPASSGEASGASAGLPAGVTPPSDWQSRLEGVWL